MPTVAGLDVERGHAFAAKGDWAHADTDVVFFVCGSYTRGVDGAMDQAKSRRTTTGANMGDANDRLDLSAQQARYVEKLAEQYAAAIGEPSNVFHVVPKSIWLHKYADEVISIPPADNRKNWVYATLLISALSDSPVELVLERPEEDTIGAIGTLARLTQYHLDCEPFDEWHTMGMFPFFGESSSVRGLLFCQPPDYLPSELHVDCKVIRLLYVAGITEEQLRAAQTEDDELGQFLGAKRLHSSLRIKSQGIANLGK